MATRQLCIFIMLYCVGDHDTSHFVSDSKNSNDCSCSLGCDFNQYCIPPGNCRKVNVALGKPAKMSSSYTVEFPSGPACVAVNGNTGTNYELTSRPNPNCIHTQKDDKNAWWEVNLGRKYTVTDISISIRAGEPKRMDNVRITVDNKGCYTFPTGTTDTPSVKNVSCTSPVQGSVVRLSRNTSDYYLNFCEVRIWVCMPGLYGEDCDRKCNCKNNETCDNYHGSCPARCTTGYYGFNCTQSCGRCKVNNTCDLTTGLCLDGCQTGFKEPVCKECKDGFFGKDCTEPCSRKCRSDLSCDQINGTCLPGRACSCPSGCNFTQSCIPAGNCRKENIALGKSASMSSSYTSNHPLLHTACLAVNGNTGTVYVSTAHPNPNCVHTASTDTNATWEVYLGRNYTITDITVYTPEGLQQRMDNVRITVDGKECYTFSPGSANASREKNVSCTSPLQGSVVRLSRNSDDYYLNFCEVQVWVCIPGLYGKDCDTKCNCKNNEVCDNYYGSCPAGCTTGYYGFNCTQSCGRCKVNSTCDLTTGLCLDGCQTGFKEPACEECSDGLYGPDCSNKCGHCLAGSSCNATNGACPDGCNDGYVTPFCNEKCQNGTWGRQCNLSCGNCNLSSCRYDNGVCENGCIAGFTGKLCLYTYQEYLWGDNTILMFGLVNAAALAVIILLGLILFLKGRGCSFNLRYVNSTRNRKPLSDGTNYSLDPFIKEPNTNKSTFKPKVTVKPRMVENVDEGASWDGVWGRARALGDSTSLENTHQQKREGVPCASEADMEEDDISLQDSEQLSDNYDVISDPLTSTSNLDNIQRYLIENLTSRGLLEEFKRLKKDTGNTHLIALLPQNVKKNRRAIVVPYDFNRIILKDCYKDGDATDYVNASYVKGVQSGTQYIAAQGPLKNTVTDFWRMIWQEKVTHIVMMSSLQEKGKNKCYKYWPDKDTTETYGPVKVTGLDVRRRAYFYTRTFCLSLANGYEHRVTQYQFTAWPNDGVPTVTSLIDFWGFVKSRVHDDGLSFPLLVHCSSGIGRTGTYIGLDIAMDECLLFEKINIAAIVERLRDDRMVMVRLPIQYVFMYKAVLEAHTGRDTKLSVDQFDTVFTQSINFNTPNERIDREFQIVMLMRSLTAEHSHTTAVDAENMSKNRNEAVLPSDDHIVHLTESVNNRNQYINAVYMSTFWKVRGTILTQLPLPDTLVDFWRLMFGNEVATVVSLGCTHEEAHIKNFCRYWPLSNDAMQIGPYCVTLKSSSRLGKHLMTYALILNKYNVAESRKIQILRFEGWSSEIPDKSDLYLLFEILDTTTTAGPIVIQCIDGGAKSGLFCCIRDIISRVTCDREVDVYMTVRQVHSVRPMAITNVEQYRFCYEIAQDKIRERNAYSNTEYYSNHKAKRRLLRPIQNTTVTTKQREDF